MKRIGIPVLLSSLGILGMNGCHQAAERRMSSMVGKAAPDFSLVDLDGSAVKLSHFRGRPMVLAFFAYG